MSQPPRPIRDLDLSPQMPLLPGARRAVAKDPGAHFAYRDGDALSLASWPLFLIREAEDGGCSFEDLADGFGPGEGTHGDWSAIRDSSPEAKRAMCERALNYIRESLHARRDRT